VNKLKSKLKTYPKLYSILRKIYFLKEQLKFSGMLAFSTLFLIMPIQKNKIIISNYFGKGYGDNGKYIVEEIMKQDLDYDLVWMLKSDLIEKSDLPEEVRIVKYKSFKALYELATAKVWIDNSRKEFYPIKRKNQYYIQTWHASMGLKRIEKDAKESLSSSYIKLAKKDSQMCDLMISGSEFRNNLYKNSFWYDGEILKSGTARCDLFFHCNDDLKIKVLKELNIPLHKKVVLYAPTFRKNVSIDFFKIQYEEIIDELKEKFGGDWVFLNRLHPNITELADDFKYDNIFYNASHYSDMQELLAITDVLITDYSSSMFDMALKNKICLLYAPDLDKYINNDRGLYFDYRKLPFHSATSLDELKHNIRKFDVAKYKSNIESFHRQIGIYEDGSASRRIVDRILEMCKK
jgi:CDP-glycerol glycerophosphotransferase